MLLPDTRVHEPVLVRKQDGGGTPYTMSILVRCYNEIVALPLFWRALYGQSEFGSLEIIFLDSGSTDGSLEYLLQQSCSVYQIPKTSFNFGRSCNQLMSLSNAPLAMFMSAHVFLDMPDTIKTIVGFLKSDRRQALYLRQVPNTELGYSAYDAAYLNRRFPPGVAPIAMKEPAAFSNAASALTRISWEALPFPEIHGSEDYEWIKRHLLDGGELYYFPSRIAMHSHNETPEKVYERVRLNALARGSKKSISSVLLLFLGIVIQTLRAGGSVKDAIRYAVNHAKAYL